MKLKILDRLVMRLNGFLTLVVGLANIYAWYLLRAKELGEEMFIKYLPLALLICGVLCVLFGFYSILVPHRYRRRKKDFIVQTTENGELRIAVSAAEELIRKCIETHKEVQVKHMHIINKRGAVNVEMLVAMNSNVSIPHAIEQLQTQIKRYLIASTGIELQQISVTVSNATGEADLPHEPLPTAAEVQKAAESKNDAASEEKVPMHQRIFGRDPSLSEEEQIVEAEMVAAPETENTEEKDPAAETADENGSEDKVKIDNETEEVK